MTNRGAPGFDPARLRRHREAAEINQSELARRADVPRGAISKYEAGQGAPNPDRLAAIAAAMGLEPVDLLDPERLGHGLASLRVAKGLRQADVAEQVGGELTVGKYRMIELGKVDRMSYADVADLARVFGVSEEAVHTAHRWDLEQNR